MSGRLSAIVAGALAAVLLLCVGSIAVLAGLDKAAPSVLENLAAGALGALAALLARVGGDTQDVQVVNATDRPVPVDPDAGHTDVVFLIGITVAVACGVILAVLVLRATG